MVCSGNSQFPNIPIVNFNILCNVFPAVFQNFYSKWNCSFFVIAYAIGFMFSCIGKQSKKVFSNTQIYFITHNLPLNVSIQRHLGLIYYLRDLSQFNHKRVISCSLWFCLKRNPMDTHLPNHHTTRLLTNLPYYLNFYPTQLVNNF